MEPFLISKITKVGTSLGIVLPVNVLRAYKWQRGDFIIFGFSDDEQLILKRPTEIELRELKPKPIIKM